MKRTVTVAELLAQFGDRQVTVDTGVVERFRTALDSYPPIDGDELADGRSKVGRLERKFNALNGLALAMLNHISDLTSANHTLALGMEDYFKEKSRADDLERQCDEATSALLPIQRFAGATPIHLIMMVQLVLLTQFRPEGVLFYPERITRDGKEPAILFSLGGIVTQLFVNPFVEAREIQIMAGASDMHTVKVDENGDISAKEMEALIGYLFMAGFKIDHDNVMLALSARVKKATNGLDEGKNR